MKNKFGLPGAMVGTLLLGGMLFISCDNDDDNGDNGKIDPNTIASSNLIAYFPFETLNEEVEFSDNTITFGDDVGAATLATGRRGNAYKGSSSEAYFEYDIASGTGLKTLDEFSLACWIKTPHTTSGAAKIFTINGGDSFMGALALLQESQAAGDSVDLKFYLFDSESPEWKGQDIRKQSAKFVNDLWFHLVAVYNKTTSTMEFYANGDFVFSQNKWAGPESGGTQPPLGPIKLGQDMTKIHFGTWTQQIAGTPESWMTYYQGMIDEFRIYNKALSADEIADLYEAEVTQINP
jgi:hypothetical protein